MTSFEGAAVLIKSARCLNTSLHLLCLISTNQAILPIYLITSNAFLEKKSSSGTASGV